MYNCNKNIAYVCDLSNHQNNWKLPNCIKYIISELQKIQN